MNLSLTALRDWAKAIAAPASDDALADATKGLTITRDLSAYSDLVGYPGSAGASGNVETSAYVMAAINYLAMSLPEAPFCIHEESVDNHGRVKTLPVTKSPLLPLLKFPGGTTAGAVTREQFVSSMVASYELDGNAYAYKRRNGFGQVVGLRWLPYWAITPQRAPGSRAPVDYYEFRVGGAVIERIQPDDMIHWRQGVDAGSDMLGCSPLKTVALDVATEQEFSIYTKVIMQNMGVIGAAMSSDDPDVDFTPEQVTEAKTQWRQFQGDGRGGLFISNTKVKFDKFSATPEEMALDTIIHPIKEKILAAIRVRPEWVALTLGLGDAKDTALKEAIALGWYMRLIPLGQSLCSRLTIDLMSEPGMGDMSTQMVALHLDGVWALQEDQNKIHERAQHDFLANLCTQNEGRAMLGLDDIAPADARTDGDRTHSEFPQLINANAGGASPDATLLNGTNGRPANQLDRAKRPMVTSTPAAKSFRAFIAANDFPADGLADFELVELPQLAAPVNGNGQHHERETS